MVPSVSPISEIVCVQDRNAGLVQIYEEHSRGTCRGAAAWNVHHYKRTSDLVLDAYRDGARDVLLLRLGCASLRLVPSFSSAGIEQVRTVEGPKGVKMIEVTYAGLGGAGLGITKCRVHSKGVRSCEILAPGGGKQLGRTRFLFDDRVKVHVGIDDTDSDTEGATWSLANEIGFKMGKRRGVAYLNHTLVQMFPFSPNRTTNCVATVLTFAVPPKGKNALIRSLLEELKASTGSAHTGMAVFEGISIPARLYEFTKAARTRIVGIEEAMSMSDLVDIYEVTGERGVIGAVGALGMAEENDRAVAAAVELAMERK